MERRSPGSSIFFLGMRLNARARASIVGGNAFCEFLQTAFSQRFDVTINRIIVGKVLRNDN